MTNFMNAACALMCLVVLAGCPKKGDPIKVTHRYNELPKRGIPKMLFEINNFGTMTAKGADSTDATPAQLAGGASGHINTGVSTSVTETTKSVVFTYFDSPPIPKRVFVSDLKKV